MTVTFENGTLKVLLSKDETVTYRIDRLFRGEPYDSAETALALLYKTALQKVSSSLYYDRLIIEVFPSFSGGCEVTFSPDKPKVPVAVKEKSHTFLSAQFSDSEVMIETIIGLYRSKFYKTRSDLYEKDGIYRLLLFPEFGSKQLLRLFSQIGCNLTTAQIDFAITKEHWRLLCKNTAIKTIGSTFFKGL